MLKNWRVAALVIALVAPLLVLLALPPIPQDPAYHGFADTRTLLGIPNLLNVASNLVFLLVGALGLASCVRHKPPVAATSWTIFFTGVVLAAFGSGYYHWAPDSGALAWDRLPMTIAFMALFAAVLCEHISESLERIALPVAIAAGVGSVIWWRYTDDLRLYAWVQFAPLVAIALLLAFFPSRFGHRAYLGYGLGFYILAKLGEAGDAWFFAFTGHVVSGHTLKHLVAALAPFCLYLMLRARAAAPRAAGAQSLRYRRSP